MIIAVQPAVEVVSAGTDWAAIVAAIVTGLAAIVGIAGTAWQASRARQTATTDLKTSLDATTANQRASIEAAAEAARDDRWWEKKSDTYADMITAVRWDQRRRQSQYFSASIYARIIPDEEPPVDPVELEGRLYAFGAPAVIAAFEATNDAATRAAGFCLELTEEIHKTIESRDSLGDYPQEYTPEIDETPHIRQVQEATNQALQAAKDKDNALIEAIRADLLPPKLAGRATKQLQAQRSAAPKPEPSQPS